MTPLSPVRLPSWLDYLPTFNLSKETLHAMIKFEDLGIVFWTSHLFECILSLYLQRCSEGMCAGAVKGNTNLNAVV